MNENFNNSQGCCGGPAPVGIDACCVKDANEKSKGNKGCGCAEQYDIENTSSSSSCCDSSINKSGNQNSTSIT